MKMSGFATVLSSRYRPCKHYVLSIGFANHYVHNSIMLFLYNRKMKTSYVLVPSLEREATDSQCSAPSQRQKYSVIIMTRRCHPIKVQQWHPSWLKRLLPQDADNGRKKRIIKKIFWLTVITSWSAFSASNNFPFNSWWRYSWHRIKVVLLTTPNKKWLTNTFSGKITDSDRWPSTQWESRIWK